MENRISLQYNSKGKCDRLNISYNNIQNYCWKEKQNLIEVASVISLVVLLLVTHLCDITYPPPPPISSHAFKIVPPHFEHGLVLLTTLTGGGGVLGDCEHRTMEMPFNPK